MKCKFNENLRCVYNEFINPSFGIDPYCKWCKLESLKDIEITQVKEPEKDHDIIPFQTCPMCYGYGTLSQFHLVYTTFIYENKCPVCNGSGVIPMAKVPKQ